MPSFDCIELSILDLRTALTPSAFLEAAADELADGAVDLDETTFLTSGGGF
jgi:hypothetical protein